MVVATGAEREPCRERVSPCRPIRRCQDTFVVEPDALAHSDPQGLGYVAVVAVRARWATCHGLSPRAVRAGRQINLAV